MARHTNANNLLYHNNGEGTFTRIMNGAIVNDGGCSNPVSWGEHENDGSVDLFVGNVNHQDNFLYNNCQGTFTKIATGQVVTDSGFSSSSNWADYDNDGDLDLFVANWNEHNFLYQNDGDRTFTKIGTAVIAAEGNVHNGSWADFDNNGDVDLFLGPRDGSNHRLYVNNGDGAFTRILCVSVVEDSGASSAVWGDYDRDGDPDLFVARDGDNLLYRNEGNPNHWINIELIGAAHRSMVPGIASDRSAIGAGVTALATMGALLVRQLQEVSGQASFIGQNSLNVEFAFGEATIVDSIVVRWPSGLVQKLKNVTADQFLTIREPQYWIFLPIVAQTGGQ